MNFADPADVAKAAEEWTEKQLRCRLNHHDWWPETAVWNAVRRFYRKVEICGCCGKARRVQEITETGRILSSQITYEPGYLMGAGLGRIAGDGRGVLRIAEMHRKGYPLKKLTKRQAEQDQPKSSAMQRYLFEQDDDEKGDY
jgi:hypothetical protein